ncbi:MAG: DNA repair protein RecO [Candidatus Microgenomates bacterium]|jgi:DNA repair protein RecO (recombination protein O)
MKPRAYTSEGIILAKRNYGEADRIISIFGKDIGRKSLIAKGVRRPRSRKRGHIEVFNKVRFQAVTGRGLDIMTEVEVVDDFKDVRKSLKKISLAYYFMEVIGKITHEGEGNLGVYELLVGSLEKLKTAKLLKKLRLEFIVTLITILGYWPENKVLPNPDEELEEIIERQIYSKRVGKRMIED